MDYENRRDTGDPKKLVNDSSAALNKWLKPLASERCVVHSSRHSMRDRLRTVECPNGLGALAYVSGLSFTNNHFVRCEFSIPIHY